MITECSVPLSFFPSERSTAFKVSCLNDQVMGDCFPALVYFVIIPSVYANCDLNHAVSGFELMLIRDT